VRGSGDRFCREQEADALADACLKLLGDNCDCGSLFRSLAARGYETQFTYPAFRDRFLSSVGPE